MAKSSSILAVKDLEISFPLDEGIFKAVKKIDLSIAPGEILGLVGESGSGKSVTALAIMRLLDKRAIWQAKELSFQSQVGDAINLLNLPDTKLDIGATKREVQDLELV